MQEMNIEKQASKVIPRVDGSCSFCWSPNYDLLAYSPKERGLYVLQSSGHVVFSINDKKISSITWNPSRDGSSLLAISCIDQNSSRECIELYTLETSTCFKRIHSMNINDQNDLGQIKAMEWIKYEQSSIVLSTTNLGEVYLWDELTCIPISRQRVNDKNITQLTSSCLRWMCILSSSHCKIYDMISIKNNLDQINCINTCIQMISQNISTVSEMIQNLSTKWKQCLSTLNSKFVTNLQYMLEGYEESVNVQDSLTALLIAGSSTPGIQQYFSRSRAHKIITDLFQTVQSTLLQTLNIARIHLPRALEAIVGQLSSLNGYSKNRCRFGFLKDVDLDLIAQMIHVSAEMLQSSDNLFQRLFEYKDQSIQFFKWLFNCIQRFSDNEQDNHHEEGVASIDTEIVLQFIENMSEDAILPLVEETENIQGKDAVPLSQLTTQLSHSWNQISPVPFHSISASISTHLEIYLDHVFDGDHIISSIYHDQETEEFHILRSEKGAEYLNMIKIHPESKESNSNMVQLSHPLIDGLYFHEGNLALLLNSSSNSSTVVIGSVSDDSRMQSSASMELDGIQDGKLVACGERGNIGVASFSNENDDKSRLMLFCVEEG